MKLYKLVVVSNDGSKRTVLAEIKPALHNYVGLIIPAHFTGTQYDWNQAQAHNQLDKYVLPRETLYRQIMVNENCPVVYPNDPRYNEIFIPHSPVYVKSSLLAL